MLPELSDAIDEAGTPYLLWFDIREAFERAYDTSPRNESLIERIYEFYLWCAEAPRGETATDDLLTCVAVCFLEHIPQHPAARADMPRWFSYQDFVGSEQIFRYHLSEQEFLDLKQHFYRNRMTYRATGDRDESGQAERRSVNEVGSSFKAIDDECKDRQLGGSPGPSFRSGHEGA